MVTFKTFLSLTLVKVLNTCHYIGVLGGLKYLATVSKIDAMVALPVSPPKFFSHI